MCEQPNRPPTAVIADDEVLIRANLQEMLEELGYQVVGSYGDGFGAIEGCQTHRPDVVLLDVKMPLLDGLAAARYITEHRLSPVVMLLTAYDDDALVEQAQQYGVAGYLVKPVSERMLRPALKVAAARSRELEALRGQVAEAKEELESRKLIERAKGRLMEREHLTEQAAFDRIREVSRRSRISMRAVAEAILHSEA